MAVAATSASERPLEGYRWDIDGRTLREVREGMEGLRGTEVRRDLSQIRVDMTGDAPSITIGGVGKDEIALPADQQNIVTLGNHFSIPGAFLKRCDPELQEIVLNHHATAALGHEALFRYTDMTLVEVANPDIKRIDPRALVDAVAGIMTPDAEVLTFDVSDVAFRLDVISPSGYEIGWGGDKRKGDITGGGVRIFQDRKANLSPSCRRLLYRLVCTNGMEMAEEGAKLDARGKSLEDLMEAFTDIVADAFATVEHDIEAFYNLRHQKIDKPEQAVARYAAENGIADSVTVEVIKTVPNLELDGAFSMFDLVNLFTNQANDPKITTTKTRHQLQGVGGEIVHEHRKRCSHCLSAIDHQK